MNLDPLIVQFCVTQKLVSFAMRLFEEAQVPPYLPESPLVTGCFAILLPKLGDIELIVWCFRLPVQTRQRDLAVVADRTGRSHITVTLTLPTDKQTPLLVVVTVEDWRRKTTNNTGTQTNCSCSFRVENSHNQRGADPEITNS